MFANLLRDTSHGHAHTFCPLIKPAAAPRQSEDPAGLIGVEMTCGQTPSRGKMTGSPVSAPSGPSEYEQMFCESWLQMRSRGGEDSWSNWKLRGQTPPQSTLSWAQTPPGQRLQMRKNGLHKREMCKSWLWAYIAAELGQRAVIPHGELRDLAVGAGGCVDGLAVRAHQDVRAPATTHTHIGFWPEHQRSEGGVG